MGGVGDQWRGSHRRRKAEEIEMLARWEVEDHREEKGGTKGGMRAIGTAGEKWVRQNR